MPRNLYSKKQGVVRHEFILGKSGTGKTDLTITICSAHASKGMEFDGVWVINADSGTWPNEKIVGPEIAEELRLFYVAITRAKEELVISHCENASLTAFMDPVMFESQRAASQAPAAIVITPEQAFIDTARHTEPGNSPEAKLEATANA